MYDKSVNSNSFHNNKILHLNYIKRKYVTEKNFDSSWRNVFRSSNKCESRVYNNRDSSRELNIDLRIYSNVDGSHRCIRFNVGRQFQRERLDSVKCGGSE